MSDLFLAIDLGGTRLKIGCFNSQSELVDFTILELPSPLFSEVKPMVEKAAFDFSQKGSGSIRGVGFSFAGLVDRQKGAPIESNDKYNDFKEVNLKEWVKTQWECNYVIDNDARLACLGEWKYGSGRGFDSVVTVTLGTGFGSGAVISSKLLSGKHYSAGILGGHLSIHYRGDRCNCGSRGCVESVASSWRLADIVNQVSGGKVAQWSALNGLTENEINFKTIFDLAKSSDPVAVKVVDHCLDAWSFGIVNLVHAYDPERVILVGGLMNDHEMIIPYISEKVDNYCWTPGRKVDVVVGKHIEKAALYGVNYLLREGYDCVL